MSFSRIDRQPALIQALGDGEGEEVGAGALGLDSLSLHGPKFCPGEPRNATQFFCEVART